MKPSSTTATPSGSGCRESGSPQPNAAIYHHSDRAEQQFDSNHAAATLHGDRVRRQSVKSHTAVTSHNWGINRCQILLSSSHHPTGALHVYRIWAWSLPASQQQHPGSTGVQEPQVTHNTATPAQGICFSRNPANAIRNRDEGIPFIKAGAKGSGVFRPHLPWR